MPNPYSRTELKALEHNVASGSPICPVCQGDLHQRAIPPRADVPYVRDRIWLICGECDKHGVVDMPKRSNSHPD